MLLDPRAIENVVVSPGLTAGPSTWWVLNRIFLIPNFMSQLSKPLRPISIKGNAFLFAVCLFEFINTKSEIEDGAMGVSE